MKLLTIIGARQQFIKAASVSRAISRINQETSDLKKESMKSLLWNNTFSTLRRWKSL